MNCQPPSKFWALMFFGVVLALPLPPAQRSHADPDVAALQQEGVAGPVGEKLAAQADRPGDALVIPAELEARLLAKLRHEIHADVEDLAMQSMERAVRQLRDRDGSRPRPIGKVLRLTFKLEPEVDGVAPVSVLTRTSAYSAFADTFFAGTSFKFNVVGDLNLVGLQHDRVTVDFSTLVQFDDTRNGESGSSGANGSAELVLGEPEVLMSVGSRHLVLAVEEVLRR